MTLSSELQTKRHLLSQAYARLGAEAGVAFIDESYVIPAQAGEGRSFYLLCAFVVAAAACEDIRHDLVSIVGGTYWHTTEAHRKGEAEKIREFCGYIADGGANESIILTIQSPIGAGKDGDEIAREGCIERLLTELQLATTCGAPSLVVFEERRHMGQRSRDQRTIKRLRQSGVLGNMQTLFTSPSVESLLWVPDIIAFTQNHKERGAQSDYASRVSGKIHVVSVETKQPPAAEA